MEQSCISYIRFCKWEKSMKGNYIYSSLIFEFTCILARFLMVCPFRLRVLHEQSRVVLCGIYIAFSCVLFFLAVIIRTLYRKHLFILNCWYSHLLECIALLWNYKEGSKSFFLTQPFQWINWDPKIIVVFNIIQL